MKRIISYCLCVALLSSSSLPLVSCKRNNDKKSGSDNGSSKQYEAVIYDMTTEDAVDPIGIDNSKPRFSWKIKTEQRGWLQSAYQIVVKQKDITVWDSGRVESSVSVAIPYNGDKLISSTKYSWIVSVWDSKGTKTTSQKAEFEMGLVEKDAFKDTKWISCEKNTFDNTKYTIDFDFIIESASQGFCFGMENNGAFVMWQVNTFDSPGRVLLRPHFKSGGNWTAYPGGPGNVQAVDITSVIGYDSTGVIGKKIHERIEVDGKVVKTYFGNDSTSLQLANTYTHSSVIPLSNVGFRHSSENGTAKEVALYDNIVVKDSSGNVLYQNDFSLSDIDFSGSGEVSLSGGMLRVGSTTVMGEHILERTSSDGLPVFRKEFSVSDKLVSAKLYTSGLGVYESYINGDRVGRLNADSSITYHELKPGFTEMSDRKFYSSYDVTHMIRQNKDNVICAIVSGSWWSDKAAANYGKENAYLARLILTYADGTVKTIVTDTSWKCANESPVKSASIFDGESYDARVSTEYLSPEFDDSSWSSAKINNEFKGTICAYIGSAVTVRQDLERKVQSVTVYDGAKLASSTQYGIINTVATYNNGSFMQMLQIQA